MKSRWIRRSAGLALLPLLLTAATRAQDVLPDAGDFEAMLERDGPQMGWTLTPEPVPEGADPTELDILSQSDSGVDFGAAIYDSRADNPLVPVSVTLRALDKITATYRDIEIPIGEQASFGPLSLLPRTCDKRPPEETPETTVFLEVYPTDTDIHGARARRLRGEPEPAAAPAAPASRIRLAGEGRAEEAPRDDALFRGWMFASSPSINALEHPVYDVWVIDCKMVEPETVAGSAENEADTSSASSSRL